MVGRSHLAECGHVEDLSPARLELRELINLRRGEIVLRAVHARDSNAGRSEAGVASEMAPKATVRAPVRIPLVNLIDSDHQRLVEEERADGVEEGDLRDEWS